MNNNNDNNIESVWTTVGARNKFKNNERRQARKHTQKIKIQKQKQYEEKQEENKYQKKNNWRQKRINLIKQKEFEEFKHRKITKEFAQAIQHERSKINMTRKDLAIKLMIQDSELALYENASKCPTSRLVVELRKTFENLPRKYFIIEQ